MHIPSKYWMVRPELKVFNGLVQSGRVKFGNNDIVTGRECLGHRRGTRNIPVQTQ